MIEGDLRDQIRQLRRRSERYATGGLIAFVSGGLWALGLSLIALAYRLESYAWQLVGWGFLVIMLVGIYLRYKSHESIVEANDLESKQDFWATRTE